MTSSQVASFSIVIPTHGGRGSVRDAVESVLAQTYQTVEVIVVSDGEGRRTRELLKDLVDPRVSILEQPKWGSAAARNVGLAAARNEWVAFLDDDDRLRPDCLSIWLAQIGETTLAVTAGAAYWRDGKQGETRRCRLSLSDRTMGASTILAGAFVIRRGAAQCDRWVR